MRLAPRSTRRLTVLFAGVVVLATALSGPVAATHDDTGCEFPFTDTDMTGTEVTLDEPAEEVVVRDAASAQVFWELGAEDRVTGMPVEEFTEYLPGSADRTPVTDGQTVLVEEVVALEPDLVIAPNYVSGETVGQLRGAGLTVYQFPLEDSFEAIYRKTTLYGHMVGACDAADATVEETRTTVEETRTAVADRDRPRVLYYFFGFTAGNGTFIHDLIVAAGGQNVAADAGITGFAEISDEVVVEENPEWVVSPSSSGLPQGEPFTSTDAFESNRTLVVDENLVSQAGPRVAEPLRAMAEAFHPDAFATPTETASQTATETETETETDAPGRNSPGFAVATAVAALLVVSLLALRRRAL